MPPQASGPSGGNTARFNNEEPPLVPEESRNRVRGGLIGVLVCDALGGPVQFKRPGEFRAVENMRPVTPFDMPAGYWSDDGSLTLCLAQSFIDTGGFSPDDFAQKACSWMRSGYLSSSKTAWDVGISTRQSLQIWTRALRDAKLQQKKGHDVEHRAQEEVRANLDRESSSGNGSLMRCAPVGLMYGPSPNPGSKFNTEAEMRRVAHAQSACTHPYIACGDACALYSVLVAMAVSTTESREARKAAMVRAIATEDFTDSVLHERMHRYQELEDWQEVETGCIKSSGWVIDTLECALWAFFSTDSFRDGALRVVNLGGDSDTAGAVFGGLAGAFYGYNEIPKEWRQCIAKREMVETLADQFFQVSLCKIGLPSE